MSSFKKFPINTGLVYNTDQADTLMRGCTAVYNLKEKQVKSFS